MTRIHDLIIVGGGPVGLAAAIEAIKHHFDFVLLESQDKLGGQLMELYPEKEIIDISGHDSILAKDYVGWLMAQIPGEKLPGLLLTAKVEHIEAKTDFVSVKTEKETYLSKAVIIATGLGVYMPRLLECRGADGCRNIIYSLHHLDFLDGKRVAILGGGDAALDWARDISRHTPNVTLIHRRSEFRGDMSVIRGIDTIKILTPYVPVSVIRQADEAYGLEIEHVDTHDRIRLDVDYIFVNYGHIPVSASFGLEKLGPGIKVDHAMETSSKRVFAIGDVASYENKKRRIDAGMNELRVVFKRLATMI